MAKKQQLIVKEMSQFPSFMKKLWGPPPILPSQDPGEYWKLALAMAQSLAPSDAVAGMLLKDLVDSIWEIRELRKHKAAVILVRQRAAFAEIKLKVSKTVQEEILEFYLTECGEAEKFLDSLSSVEMINELIEKAQERRRAALREIEDYEARLAGRRRKALDHEIIEAEYTKTDPIPGATGNERPKADNDPMRREVS
jgi:hypothetical protein